MNYSEQVCYDRRVARSKSVAIFTGHLVLASKTLFLQQKMVGSAVCRKDHNVRLLTSPLRELIQWDVPIRARLTCVSIFYFDMRGSNSEVRLLEGGE